MAIVLVKPCVKLFSLPRTLLIPLIIPICVIGAYAVNLNYFDVYIMLAAGLVGYLLHQYGFPLAPMVLAVILGPRRTRTCAGRCMYSRINPCGGFCPTTGSARF